MKALHERLIEALLTGFLVFGVYLLEHNLSTGCWNQLEKFLTVEFKLLLVGKTDSQRTYMTSHMSVQSWPSIPWTGRMKWKAEHACSLRCPWARPLTPTAQRPAGQTAAALDGFRLWMWNFESVIKLFLTDCLCSLIISSVPWGLIQGIIMSFKCHL